MCSIWDLLKLASQTLGKKIEMLSQFLYNESLTPIGQQSSPILSQSFTSPCYLDDFYPAAGPDPNVS